MLGENIPLKIRVQTDGKITIKEKTGIKFFNFLKLNNHSANKRLKSSNPGWNNLRLSGGELLIYKKNGLKNEIRKNETVKFAPLRFFL